MAQSRRSPRGGSSGPGRSQQRRARSSSRAAASAQAPQEPRKKAAPSGIRFTRRAVALGILVIALLISFGGTLQVYFAQQRDLAVAEQQIRDRQAQIGALETELARWNDPAYVKAQARERLGWVMPGETGYRVVDDQGNPLGGGVVLQPGHGVVAGEGHRYWWQKLSGSIQTADSPRRQVAPR